MYIRIHIMSSHFVYSMAMARKTPLPAHQERSRESLERLLLAAQEILEKDGLDKATIPRIAKRAGLSTGAVYRRFPDKDALLRTLLLRFVQANTEKAERVLKPELWEGRNLKTMVRSIFGGMVTGYRQRRRLFRSFVQFVDRHPDAAFRRRAEKLELRSVQKVTELLLSRRGEIHHPNPELAVNLGMMMVVFTLREIFLMYDEPLQPSAYLNVTDEQLNRELPNAFLRYLGLEEDSPTEART
jgi:AcrR family transcriptional regulator